MTQPKDVFQGLSAPRAIAKFAVPTILSQLVTLLYNLADPFFVGQTNDPSQVAALTLSFPLFMSLTMVGNLFGIGANSFISRSLGKYFGAGISAKMAKCNPNVVKYLGITLLPQAGVALGMAIKAIELGPEGAIVRNITLFAVLIYEIVGPFLTKVALTKAGDINEEGRKSARDEHLLNKQKQETQQ
mgnify:CR=1 FL=1